jgi:hypothetical protein
MKTSKNVNSKSNPEQKSSSGAITILDFKFYYGVIVTEIAWY